MTGLRLDGKGEPFPVEVVCCWQGGSGAHFSSVAQDVRCEMWTSEGLESPRVADKASGVGLERNSNEATTVQLRTET